MSNIFSIKRSRGFVSLMILLITSSVMIALVISNLGQSVGNAQKSLGVSGGYQAGAYAESCAEAALYQVWLDQSFAGTASLSFSLGTCDYVVSQINPEVQVEIQATGSFNNSTARLRVVTSQTQPNIRIASWEFVDSF